MSDHLLDEAFSLLKSAISAAVPLWIEEFKSLSFDERQEIAKQASQEIAEHGDLILYKSKKKGETAKAFNELARGIAALAFCPGGVTFMGMKFEVLVSLRGEKSTDVSS